MNTMVCTFEQGSPQINECELCEWRHDLLKIEVRDITAVHIEDTIQQMYI